MSKRYLGFSLLVIAIAVLIFYIGYTTIINKDSTEIRAVELEQEIDTFKADYVVGDAEKAVSKSVIQVYEVFASWCIPCRKSVPTVLEFEKNNPQVEVIGIAFRDVDFEIMEFMDDYGNFDHVLKSNGSLESAFGISSVPQTVFVKENTILYRIFGSIDLETLNEILSLVESKTLSS